jgi:ParB family chromosome partitioning protein
LTASSDVTPSVQEDPPAGQPALTPGGGQQPAEGYMERPMIPVALLTAHPGNVRADRQADRQFCQSVAGAGIITPLEITTSPDGGYVVVDGNIRLDAAIKVGLDAVPYVFSPGTADHAGQQYLHMLISSRFRRDLSVHEEAAALFCASQAGMSRAQIRRATGLKATEVRAGITAGGLSASTREVTGNAEYEWTLEDLALLAPFEDDPEAMSRILQALDYGQPLAYIAQKLTDECEQHARRGKLLASLHERGVTVVDQPPPGAVSVSMLRAGPPPGGDTQSQDSDVPGSDSDGPGQGVELAPAAHESCPGAVVVLRPWQEEPSWYCLDPGRYGHVRALQRPIPAAATGGAGSVPDAGSAGGGDAQDRSPGGSPTTGPDRKLVIEGNRAWGSAASVRHRWLAEFLSRKAPPADTAALVAQFVTGQMLTMPQPLRQALAHIHGRQMYRVLGGPAPDAAGTAAQPRLWLLALAPIAASYEDQMTGSGEQRSTWRTERYSPCPRAHAGTWLRFLAQAGHQLSPIEQAIADGVPYQGDTPGDSLDGTGPSDPGTGADQAGTPPRQPIRPNS